MQINVNVNGQAFSFDTETAPEAATRYFLEYGARQSLADAGAAKPEVEAKRAAAQARFNRILAGDIPSGGGGGGVNALDAAVALLLRSGKVRKLASTKYAAEDVPSARDKEALTSFGAAHFTGDVLARVEKAAQALVAAKQLAV